MYTAEYLDMRQYNYCISPRVRAIASLMAIAQSQQSSTFGARNATVLSQVEKIQSLPELLSTILNVGASPASNWHLIKLRLSRGLM